MDLLSQGLIGAACAQSGASREDTRKSAIIGFCAGMLADADYLIQSADDPLLNLDFHRHFSHALVFIPVGALIATVLLWPFFRRTPPVRRIFRFALLGYLPSGLLDACTSYGTYLFWPFLETRIALHLLSVVDPLLSLVLLSGVIGAFVMRRSRPARIALAICLLYLSWAFVQQNRVREVAFELARERGDMIERLIVKPSFANTILWRSVYLTRGHVQVDAVRAAARLRVYPGERIARFDPERESAIAPDTRLYDDMERFRFFADDFIGVHPDRPGILGDVRYAMLPNSALPLWGIELDYSNPDRHARFQSFRKLTPEGRRHFMDMLMGRAAEED